MRIDILTLFPEMFAPLQASMMKRAQDKGLLDLHITNIRDYALDKHQVTDDRPYGGGAGMVMKPEPLSAATEGALTASRPRIIVLSPAGRPYTQALARELAQEEQLILVCGHYEGIDQRYIDRFATDLISLGDFVLTGGETAALAITDSVVRLLPGALGDESSAQEESFSEGLLEYPQYTRPPEFQGQTVPEVLQKGNHAQIRAWRRQRSLELTYRNRPDLLAQAPLTEADAAFLGRLRAGADKPFRLYAALLHYPVYNKKKQIVNTSVTNLDLHDIARAAKTYALAGYYIVQPMAEQRTLFSRLLEHWRSGFGGVYNPDRKDALELVGVASSLERALEQIQAVEKARPRLIATGAGIAGDIIGYPEMGALMRSEGGPYLLLLGTGWGLAREVTDSADFRLQPIYGLEGYNHLSVRSAAAIIFDRLLGQG